MSGSFQFLMSSKDFDPETIDMDMKEEMNSQDDDSGEEFFRERETTLIVDEIKNEEMDLYLHHNSTAHAQSEDHSNLNLETMYSIAHAECESTEVEEKDLKDFYHDILLCDRDCETCVKYMRTLREHVRTTHASHQPIRDPLLIDGAPVPLTVRSSSPIPIKSDVEENILKMELDCSASESTSGDEFIRESETTFNVDKIEIKHEEIDFHLRHNSTAQVFSEVHSDHKMMSSISNVECGYMKAEEKDLKDFYDDILCDRDCGTCIKYMEMLKEHVRATHASHQPIQEPLLVDPVLVPLTDQSSLSIQIKSEVDENIVKIECSEPEEVTVRNFDYDSDYNAESDSESDPDYAPTPSLTQKPGHQNQVSVKNHTSSQSTSLKSKKENLPSREHFKCEECGKSFNRMSYLKAHMRVHTGEKPFKCDVCDKSFSQASNLRTHKRIHSEERPYKCNVCDMSFKSSTHLKEHTRVHTGDKPFKCDLCEKSFAWAYRLNEHKRFHAGEKLFKCNSCEIRFTSRYFLTSHQRIHSGQEPFQCDVCEKSFSTLNILTAHKSIHTREKLFKCNECDKSFTLKGALTTHSRIHTGEKCFQCDQCEKGFTQKWNLIAHKRNHTGERPYMCDQCGKRFTRQSNFADHKKIHT